MKKYLMTGMAALTLCAAFTSCSHDDFEQITQDQIDKAKYDQAFLSYVGGTISPEQTWGFSDVTRGITRSIDTPAVPHIDVNAVKDYAAEILAKSVELDENNLAFNNAFATTSISKGHPAVAASYTKYNISYNYEWGSDERTFLDNYLTNWWTGNYSAYGNATSQDEAWDVIVPYLVSQGYQHIFTYTPAQEATEDEVVWDPRYVVNYKISSTFSGVITPMGNAGLKATEYSVNDDNTLNITKTDTVAKTVYIDNGGKWTIPAGTSTTVGQGITKSNGEPWGTDAVIIVGNGGTLEVNGTMNMANCARLIVLPGGQVTGTGLLQVNNGNLEGAESYNGGTISVAVFNNNFGKFYNYGKFLSTEYRAGAQESNFYNHGIAHIKYTGNGSETPNARIFNACQFYCEQNMRVRNYEGVSGSALIVGGQFMPFGSEDGTSIPSYVSLAAGALIKCATLYNGSSWNGPTFGGYAALEITDKIVYINWVQDHPEQGGYFANNLYVKCGTWQNDPDGQGKHQDDETDTENYKESRAEYKFWTVAANSKGNGNVTKVTGDANWLINADEDFVLGETGCTPGFKGSIEEEEEEEGDIRVIAEDLSATQASDFDFNDVVFDIIFDDTNATIILQAAGGTLPLRIDGKDEWEVHKLFNVDVDYMVNTNAAKQNLKGNNREAAPVPFKLGRPITTRAQANEVKVEVYKNGVWQELRAPKGEPASKLAVDIDYTWLDERTSIKDTYTKFVDWANANQFQSRWWK